MHKCVPCSIASLYLYLDIKHTSKNRKKFIQIWSLSIRANGCDVFSIVVRFKLLLMFAVPQTKN